MENDCVNRCYILLSRHQPRGSMVSKIIDTNIANPRLIAHVSSSIHSCPGSGIIGRHHGSGLGLHVCFGIARRTYDDFVIRSHHGKSDRIDYEASTINFTLSLRVN